MAFGPRRGGRARAQGASLRAPLSQRVPGTPPPSPPGDRPSLRLAVSRGLLGIELDAPFALGPLRVAELALSLPGVRFPVDLSGGVARFRHRRGELLHLALEAPAEAIARWAAPRLRTVLAERSPEVAVVPLEGGFCAGMRAGEAALAFDVLIAPLDGDVRFLPESARGIGLRTPPQALALRALAAALGPLGRVVRGGVIVAGAAAQVARHVLPAAGARAPSAAGVRWSAPSIERSGEGSLVVALEGDAGVTAPALGDRVLRALEVTDLAGDADDAAYEGDFDRARRLYLAALERAPRHPEISHRLAWIDVITGDRPEGALSTIIDAMPAASAGVLGGALLAAVDDVDGARVAITRAAHAETYGPLAALAWLEAARLADAAPLRLDALDHAVARCPSMDLVRWARLEARLDVADLRGARADAEHLEAAVRGAEARHAVWRRAAEAFLARRYVVEAGALFERALRYSPDDARAVAGLARSLRGAGQERRAVDLFARAAALAARAGADAHGVSIDLARALAELAGDRPAAVARVGAIPSGVVESAEARFLEGRWRAELGDLAGAAIAFGRFRDEMTSVGALDSDRASSLAAMLIEAADIEEREREDVHAAQRSLGLALRLKPRDTSLASHFRRVAALVAKAAPVEAPRPLPPAVVAEAPRALPEVPPQPREPRPSASKRPPIALPPAEANDENLVPELTDRLRADPHDHATAMRLADSLERLGRDIDLLALLSARLDEGDADERREVVPRRRAVLLRLAHEAREAGRTSEAELYEMMASSDGE